MRRVMGALIAAWLAVMAVPGVSWAEDAKVPAATRLAAKSHPAVQLILTKYAAELTVPSVGLRDGNFKRLTQEVTRDVLEGEIPRDKLNIAKALIGRMAKNVDEYLEPIGPDRVVKAETAGTCTGWWVTADGYMVTGAHCVKPDQKQIAQTFAKQALTDLAKGDAANVKALLSGVRADEELNRMSASMFATFNAGHLKMDGLTQSTSVLQSMPGGGVDKTAKELPAEVVAAGESYPGKDVALLKVGNQQNLPTLALGDDKDAQVGDTLYIDGFPGTVTNNGTLSVDSRLQPTFTQGPYNAQRTTQGGVPYIQTQAPAYGGNSGGPVFSDSGRVVGILIAGMQGADGQSAQNQQLVLPVSVVKEKLRERNVRPALSPTSAAYNQALDSFFKKHYKNAVPKFKEVQNLYPGHPYVAKYISDSQTAITDGKDETPLPASTWLLIAGITAALLLAAGLVVLLLVRRRRRPANPHGGGFGTPQGPMPNGVLPPLGPPPGQDGPFGPAGPPQGRPMQHGAPGRQGAPVPLPPPVPPQPGPMGSQPPGAPRPPW
ncbi:trypsin-like peptidase domain-containing protein [Spirillospora sp. NPDC050679]